MSAVFEHPLAVANQHALASIIRTTSTHTIIASEDIIDERGQKLWARDQTVTASLQQRLLERKLKRPLEACLKVEDGVTTHTLATEIEALLASDHPLAKPLRPWAAPLLKQVHALPLHAAVTLLLTVSRQEHPEVFGHSIVGMTLAGAMGMAAGAPRFDVRLAMLGGLLHDLGEMYINPVYLNAAAQLDTRCFKHVLIHPHIGAVLMAELTDYPPALGRAIGEHHERLDGSGYPAHHQGPLVSDLGRMLAVVETVLGAASRAGSAPLSRASLALRAVPGEYDPQCVSFVCNATREQIAMEDQGSERTPVQLTERGQTLRGTLEHTLSMASALSQSRLTRPGLRQAAQRVETLLLHLQVGWNAAGLWHLSLATLDAGQCFEVEQLQNEIAYRLGAIARECLIRTEGLGVNDAAGLMALHDGLQLPDW
jgi:HD-GYP domain-containing protein (c-di-GMP phosphodiesterase class II)